MYQGYLIISEGLSVSTFYYCYLQWLLLGAENVAKKANISNTRIWCLSHGDKRDIRANTLIGPLKVPGEGT